MLKSAAMRPDKLRSLLLALVAWMLGATLAAASPSKATAEAERTLKDFISAFENLDMERFIGHFAEDATFFYPIPEPPQRFDGKAAIQAHFVKVFANARKASSATSPPFHRITPEDLKWQVINDDTVIATFHLRNATRIARRTVVLNRRDRAWLIVHLHASNVPM